MPTELYGPVTGVLAARDKRRYRRAMLETLLLWTWRIAIAVLVFAGATRLPAAIAAPLLVAVILGFGLWELRASRA
jgi:hypothetical protein